MEISLKYLGRNGNKTASIIEMKVEVDGGSMTTDVLNNNGLADKALIEMLRDVADELEEHNELRKQEINNQS